ncbi:hypothetical protein, partial [Streptococcus pneumoniae]|uniref:hypothetical protein n=1 Tax=Streptococcus pneumoniae TaxID=1313 RepID=UPI001E4E094D
IVGSGAVLQRKGQTLSSFGSKHKWSFVKGKSKGGHDVCYYFDVENKIMMRVGYDGSVPISIEHGMHAWFDDNSTWIYNYDTPADDFGICSFWNQQYL